MKKIMKKEINIQEKVQERCEDLLSEFGLQSVRKNKGELLSGGERRSSQSQDGMTK